MQFTILSICLSEFFLFFVFWNAEYTVVTDKC